MTMKALVAKYGPAGSPIPGTKMFRAYCVFCGGPMRVTDSDRGGPCTDCQHHDNSAMSRRPEGQAVGYAKVAIDHTG